MANLILKVGPMCCEQCIASVVSAISVIPGVHYVTVSPRHGEIAVGYEEVIAGLEQFKRAAFVMGYKADEMPLESIPAEVLPGACLHTPRVGVARYRAA